MKLLLCAVLILVLCPLAYSRIGENRAQIVERLGKPVGYSDGGGTVHHKNGFLIMVSYHRGIADRISYMRQKTVADDATPIMPSQRMVLMSNNSHEQWTPDENGIFKTSMMQAYYDPVRYVLTITALARRQRETENNIRDAAGL